MLLRRHVEHSAVLIGPLAFQNRRGEAARPTADLTLDVGDESDRSNREEVSRSPRCVFSKIHDRMIKPSHAVDEVFTEINGKRRRTGRVED